MKIARLACGLGILACFGACAQRAPEATAPSASAVGTPSPSPPAAEAAPIAAPASPAPAEAPQGLDGESGQGKSDDLDREFATLEAAEQALNQAKADLDRLALAKPSPEPAMKRRSASAGPEENDKAAAPATRAGAPAGSAPSALCENACRAFSSLSRAASAVCRLDGKDGAHCARAKRMRADSQQRVTSCACTAD